jgi:hypothetical protein
MIALLAILIRVRAPINHNYAVPAAHYSILELTVTWCGEPCCCEICFVTHLTLHFS